MTSSRGLRSRAGALALALAVGAASSVAVVAPAAADSRAVVVIDTGAGVRSAVVTFGGEISGLRALELAGADPVTYGYAGQGLAVCALDGVGHEATGGECLGTPDDPRYWSYWRAPTGASGWSYSRGGAGATVVRDGDVEGWRFGTGQAPRQAPDFCALAGCPNAAPAGARPDVAAGGEASPSPPGPPPPGAAPAASAGDPRATPSPGTAPSTGPPTTALSGTGSPATRRDLDGRALAAPRRGAHDDGSGSPWGVVVAGVVTLGLGLTAASQRRRARRAG